jgi:thiol-disulfide isomerase/thioredoxin
MITMAINTRPIKLVNIFTIVVILLLAISIGGGHYKVQAAPNSCGVSVNPAEIPPSTTADLQFVVTNYSSNPLLWAEVTVPSSNYIVNGGSGAGWNEVSNSDTSVTFRLGNIAPAESKGLNISTTTSSTHPQEEWTVKASDDPDGANPFTCSGSPSTSINGQAPDTIPPNIYNIAVKPLSSTSVAISWITDEAANSQINYGTDANYDSTSPLVDDLVTAHNATLSSLQSNTAYHYQIMSVDAAGNLGTSSDNTFLTVTPDNNSQATNGSRLINSPNSPFATPIPIKLKPTEKVPPTISFNTSLNNPYKETPQITGAASDNEALAGIFYSTDGGRNWLLAEITTGLGTKVATFSFKPQNLEDGNYQILARAVDTSGNIGLTKPITLVIDRLPPTVGGNVVSLGPQILEPDRNNSLTTLTNLEQKITLSAVGGPTSINLLATSKDKAKPQVFTLTQSVDSGLWSGILSFKKAGSYTLVANSIDGAGNKTSRILDSVNVSSPSHIANARNNKPLAATITAYYTDPDTNNWVVWDGASYGQDNPQATDSSGNFKLMLPPGKYYLKITAKGYRPLITNSFNLSRSEPIFTTLTMKPGTNLKLGSLNLSWPNLSATTIDLEAQSKGLRSSKDSVNNVKGSTIPALNSINTNNQAINTLDWLGKPTIVTFLSSWSPATPDQLNTLAKLQKNPNLNVEPVGLQENIAKLKAYNQIAGLSLQELADPDSTLAAFFAPKSLPTHYFIDRSGVVKEITTGTLSEKELLDKLSSL